MLRLIGQVDKVAQQTGKWTKDLHLTVFENFWHDQRLVLIFSIIVGVGSVVFGAYKIYQEVRKHV
ncbi:MAG: hypothetical protein U1E82_08530 [Nitrosomonas sp.]|nr:hypothetical protein [Nitrosomonas sp.]